MKHCSTGVPDPEARLPTPGWVGWTALAFFATLAHVLIDVHIGLWGETSDEMSLLQAVNAMARAAIYGWWLLVTVVALNGDQWALRSALMFAVVYAVFLNGLAAFAAAPPPSAAFPYQDVAHGLSLVIGGVAALSIWASIRRATPGGRLYVFIVTTVLLVLAEATSALVFFQSR